MTSAILLTGGTGTLRRPVLRRLRDANCEVRVLSRQSHEAEDGIQFVRGELVTGEGIEAAVEGAEISEVAARKVVIISGATSGG